MKQKLIIIGNGMAPGRMLEHLIEVDADRYDITIFNAEPRVNYDRIMLSPVLSGEKTYEDIIIHSEEWYRKNDITLHKPVRIDTINPCAKTVRAADGTQTAYDRLVIATGSIPFILPIPGNRLKGVLTYRDLDDVETMLESAKTGGRAIVIGGGLLGLEAAAGLKMRGMDVTVLHLAPTLMERQLDPPAGYLLEKAMHERGIEVLTGVNTKAILGNDKVEGVELADGRRIDCSLVVMAAGILPATELAKKAGLAVNRGIIVNDQMQASLPDIYALGECVEHNNRIYGLVAPLYEMARVLADTLLEKPAAYTGSQTSTKLKVTGVNLFSAGDFSEGNDHEEIVLRDAKAGVYKRLIIKDSRIIGTVLYGDAADGAWYFDMLKRGTVIDDFRDTIIFGQAHQGGEKLDPVAAVAALPDDAEICGCNGVCKSTIIHAILEKGLTSVEDVRTHTKASASCGTCTGLVEKLLTLTLGDVYNPTDVKSICNCTDIGHAEVRRRIRTQGLASIPAVMQELEWKTSCGCAKCRPALNYYLLSTWPDSYQDDGQSRHINERIHANIQKDGTYSVVPRMWGGMTSAAELHTIADIADKYKIPAVKMTGGQRIDLLGITKEKLPFVWAELNNAGMISGAAYAKGLRTVKTCVGSTWCRFGTQDSTGLGIKLEKFMWGSWTPAKLKMGISGCPRNCSEATCKDIGIICVDSGFDIHYGGAAGLELKQTELLCHVKSADEAIEIIAALTQLYREEGHYLERIYKWIIRAGSDTIKAQVIDDIENRKALFDRFVHSQEIAQIDPWAAQVSGKVAYEFSAMAEIGFSQTPEY